MKAFLNFRALGLLFVAFVLCTTGAFATDTAITIPALGIDWAASAQLVCGYMVAGLVGAFGIGIALLCAVWCYASIRSLSR